MTVLPISFDQDGLIPVVIQDDQSDAVLMLAFMNREALEKTRETGNVHFWSRSRQKLWMKGETSGHVQAVRSIHVNCYENSLLVRVEQTGACCHTGFSTCYFRELDADGQLVETGERLFDPEEVYARQNSLQLDMWLGAYQFLATNDLSDVSGTSKMLHSAAHSYLASRVADELMETAGVLTGEHRHIGIDEDLTLEGSQTLYWSVLTALRAGLNPDEIRGAFHSALASTETGTLGGLPDQVIQLATRWRAQGPEAIDELIQATVGTLGRVAEFGNTTVSWMIAADLAELRTRPYLEPFFTSVPH